MRFNKVGIYYVHWEQHDLLWRSIVSQVDFVDYIFVLDSSLEKQELKIPDYCKHKVEVEHTHKFGSGFENQYGLGYFEQVDARNYAMDKVFEKCDFMFICDADEFYSPQAFVWARTVEDAILNLPEVVWKNEHEYALSPHRHVRGGNKSTGVRHTYNSNTSWLDNEGFHRSRHVVYKWSAGQVKPINNLWHNHLHYMYHPFKNLKLISVTEGDPSVLWNGVFPSAYREFIDLRKENPHYGARKRGIT